MTKTNELKEGKGVEHRECRQSHHVGAPGALDSQPAGSLGRLGPVLVEPGFMPGPVEPKWSARRSVGFVVLACGAFWGSMALGLSQFFGA